MSFTVIFCVENSFSFCVEKQTTWCHHSSSSQLLSWYESVIKVQAWHFNSHFQSFVYSQWLFPPSPWRHPVRDETSLDHHNPPPEFQRAVLKSLLVSEALSQERLKLLVGLGDLLLNAADHLFRQMRIQRLSFLSHRIQLALPVPDRVQNGLVQDIKEV